MKRFKQLLAFCTCMLAIPAVQAQFIDHFNTNNLQGWQAFTGDGYATMQFGVQQPGFATIDIDARNDPFNVWYAITKRSVAPFVDMKSFKDPNTELRVEARVRIFNPPHRVNFMVNTQRTTDYHHDLMEFELPDTGWHIISMTTKNLDAVPGDSLYIQFNVTDFGYEQYRVDVDYIKADVIDVRTAGPDKGIRIPYHPAIAPVSSFTQHLPAAHNAVIHTDFARVNFSDWSVQEPGGKAKVLTVTGNQWAILRWNPNQLKQWIPDSSGVLELTTHSVFAGGNYLQVYGQQLGEEFPRIRVIEIFEGQPDWVQETVSYHSLVQGKPYAAVFNTQMIYDVLPNTTPGGKTYITLSAPVMQRLLNGTTKGLLIRPLGAITASFYALRGGKAAWAPTLHFNAR